LAKKIEEELNQLLKNRFGKQDHHAVKGYKQKGMSYTEEDWVDEDATSHRGPDD
jgi:hypothetical protein